MADGEVRLNNERFAEQFKIHAYRLEVVYIWFEQTSDGLVLKLQARVPPDRRPVQV